MKSYLTDCISKYIHGSSTSNIAIIKTGVPQSGFILPYCLLYGMLPPLSKYYCL